MFPLEVDGYKSKTVDFKSTKDGTIKLDVFYPENVQESTRTVVLHYHGGFLVVGDRYAFFPYWMSTAQSSVEDAIDAYQWVLSRLPSDLGCNVASVLMAGSSAGGYLALATAASVPKPPSGLLLIYGMLDPIFDRYLIPGTDIFGRPPQETSSTLAKFPIARDDDGRKRISAYPLPSDPSSDAIFALIGALHVDALVPDYMTGMPGLSNSIRAHGIEAIPHAHRNLFPLSFGDLSRLPPALLIHGEGDSAVPSDLSTRAAEALRKAGVEVDLQLPTDAEHGFDARAGDIDIEGPDSEKVAAYQVLRHAVKFLDNCNAALAWL